MKKILLIFIIIIFSLMLVSCNANKVECNFTSSISDFNKSEITYMATNIIDSEIVDGIFEAKVTSDGNFFIQGYKDNGVFFEDIGRIGDCKYILIDKEGNLIRELHSDKIEIATAFDINIDDNIYIIQDPSGTDWRKLFVYDLEGNLIKVSEEVLNENNGKANGNIKKIKVDNDGLIYGLNFNRQIEVIDDNCKTIDIIGEENKYIIDFDIDDENNIFLIEQDISDGKQRLVKYKLKGKELEFSNELEWELTLRNIMYDKKDNLIYCIGNESVLLSFDDNGKPKESLFDYKKTTPLEYILSIEKIDDILYFIASDTRTDGEHNLYALSKTDKVKIDEDELIVAFNMYEEDSKKIIETFRKIYPDIKIRMIDQGDLSSEQFLQTINTELMLGKGPDIFYGKFPFQDYMDKDILLDLNEYIMETETYKNGEYHNNILEALEYKDGLYVFPATFNFTQIYANRKLLDENNIQLGGSNWTIKDLENIVDKVCGIDGEKGNYSFDCYDSPSVLLEDSIYENLDKLIDYNSKKANFDSDNFRELLVSIKRMEDKKSTKDKVPNVLFSCSSSYNYMMNDYLDRRGAVPDDYTIIRPPRWLNEDKHLFYAELCGINKNTKNKDNAIKFIEFLSSETFGISYEFYYGFHVNKNVNKLKKELYTKGSVKIPEHIPIQKLKLYINKETREKNVEDNELIKLDEANKIEATIESLNYYNFRDLPIFDELYNYLDDKQDLDTTIMNIQNKAELFIGE